MATEVTNAVQAEHWNGPEGAHWAAEHRRYDAMLDPFGARVLDAAAILPGERVVDVGCGAGGMALDAARAAGPEGLVVGVDLSVPLVDAAGRRAAAAGVGNVSFVVGDAQAHGLGEGEFDVMVSRFGVMFFADPVAAFANLARGLRPGGRLVFVCWQDAGTNEWMLVPSMAALAHVPPPSPAVFEGMLPFEFADTGRVAEVLGAAGFVDVAFTGVEQRLLFGGGGTIDEAVEFFRDGSFGLALLAAAGRDEAAAALAAVTEEFRGHATGRGVELGAAAWLVTATIPAACPAPRPAGPP